MKTKLNPSTVLQLAATLAMAVLSHQLANATPYATSLTNNAGVVSFRLNQTTATNDTVLVISGGGAVTNVLQAPSADPAKVLSRGLIVTNLNIGQGSFKIYVKHVGSGVISTNSPRLVFGNATLTGIRGIAANRNPASPYFGWVYVANSQTNTTLASRGDGIFAFSSDLSDILGQGNVPKTGGYDFGNATNQQANTPFKVTVAPDDSVLVSDWSDVSGNLITMDPLLNSHSYVLKPLQGTAAAPVGANNNHGSISGAVIVGSGASRVLYTSDEDYQTDPTSGIATEWNSIWRYDIGNGPLPWTNAPNRKLMSPFLTGFAGQNQKIEVVGNYLYANQRRANAPQHDVYIVDLNNLQDPGSFTGATPWGAFWTSQGESLAAGFNDDVLRDTMAIAVSPDGKWFAAIIAAGSSLVTAPDGSSAATVANDVFVIPLTNGLPNLAARQVFRVGGASTGRDVAFDAAHNLIFGSSGVAYVQSLDIGESTEATTGSDGTFNLTTPATQVTVTATTPLALEQGTTPGVFTITRTPEDIGNPMTIVYTISGSATNGVDYAAVTNSVTIAAGQTSATINVTPIDDSVTELSETVVLTIRSGGAYSVGFPLSATVSIADNETPQLQIVSLSTNIYQGSLQDYAALRLRRLGDTNVALTLDASNFALGGTAVLNVEYRLADLPFTIPAGVVDFTHNLIYPLDATTSVGAKSILLTNLAKAGYTVNNNTAATTLVLKGVPPETVLYANDFEGDSTGAQWDVRYGTLTNATPDYAVVFNYDYTAGGLGNLPSIPPAPHSTRADTHGLYLTVNKGDDLGAAAALNLYLKNRTFGSNYALRFDMYLVRNSAGTPQSRNETALFGINHTGTRTNWIRNAVPGTGAGANKFDSDGLWATVEADASTTINFGLWSAPTYTNTAAVVGPTNFLPRLGTTTTQIFKKPPYDAGPADRGVPANTILSQTPTWVEVELSQLGNVITWKMNNTVILSYTNTTANTASYTNGTIMLGYNDPWDDIGNSTAGSGEACVIYDNVRVVALSPPAIATQPSNIVAPAGAVTNLTVVASTVTGTTNYQWLRNGVSLPGETRATLNFPALVFTNYGTYAIVINDGAYSTVSASATVLPPGGPTIVASPQNTTGFVGSPVSLFGMGATLSGLTNYAWLRGSPLTNVLGANYTGLTNTTLNILSAQLTNAGPYALRIGDGFNFITSAVANLTIIAQPVFTTSLSGTNYNLTFTTQIGSSYVLEWKGALTNGAWNQLITNAGTGNPITVTTATGPDPQRYYRIRLQ